MILDAMGVSREENNGKVYLTKQPVDEQKKEKGLKILDNYKKQLGEKKAREKVINN